MRVAHWGGLRPGPQDCSPDRGKPHALGTELKTPLLAATLETRGSVRLIGRAGFLMCVADLCGERGNDKHGLSHGALFAPGLVGQVGGVWWLNSRPMGGCQVTPSTSSFEGVGQN